MISKAMLRNLLVWCGAVALFWGGVAVGQNKFGTPSTIVHVVTIKWAAEASDEDKKKALDGVKVMGAAIPGIKNVWIKATKVQPQGYNDAFVIEFEDKAAAERYVNHPAHLEWEKHYLKVRGQSTSHQISN